MYINPSKIKGKVKISGSKNAGLPIIAASLVTSKKLVLSNVADISDINNMLAILDKIGCKVKRSKNKIFIDSFCNYMPLLFEEVSKFRASYYLMSSYLALFSSVSIKMPGGCKIGSRPIDFHLEGFKAAGCKVEVTDDIINISVKELAPFIYRMPKKSLGATVNLIILASKIDGKSIIENASTEPEIDDLIEFINKGFAKVYRRRNDIVIYGNKEFSEKITHKIIPDRIEAFTYMCIGLNSKKLAIKNIELHHLKAPLKYLKMAEAKFKIKKNSVTIYKSDLKPINVYSNHYPELSTDQMPLLYPIFMRVPGQSSFREDIYEERFSVCEELKKTNADIKIDNKTIFINGKYLLKPSEFYPTDLRCAASLLIEGIINGNSVINNLNYLERGYDNIYKKLKKIGLKFKIK